MCQKKCVGVRYTATTRNRHIANKARHLGQGCLIVDTGLMKWTATWSEKANASNVVGAAPYRAKMAIHMGSMIHTANIVNI